MRRTCDVEHTQDFHRYYTNGWLGMNLPGAAHVTPVLIAAAQADIVAVKQLSKGLEGGFVLSKYTNYPWQDFQRMAQFGRPDIGMIRLGPSVCFTSFSTPRNAHKGFRPGEIRQYDFNSWQIREKVALGRSRDNYDTVWQAFNPNYPSVYDGWKQLEAGEAAGVPLTRTFALYTVPDCPHPLLAYKRWTIGHMPYPNLVRLNRPFEEYRADVARKLNIEVQVI